MLRKCFSHWLVAGCSALALSGCVIPGGGTYYQPKIPKGKTASDVGVAAGHKDTATREFDGLKIQTRSWGTGNFLRVQVGFAVKKSHSLAADFGRAEIESESDGKKQRLMGTRPMVHVYSREMNVRRNELTVGSKASYSLYFRIPKPAPADFVLVIPDLRLDGKQLGPLHISYHRKSGVWLYWFSL